MTFEQFWNANGHGWEHGRAEYNLAQLAWNSAIEEAAKHATNMKTSATSQYHYGWNAAIEMIVGDFKALSRPVPGQEEK